MHAGCPQGCVYHYYPAVAPRHHSQDSAPASTSSWSSRRSVTAWCPHMCTGFATLSMDTRLSQRQQALSAPTTTRRVKAVHATIVRLRAGTYTPSARIALKCHDGAALYAVTTWPFVHAAILPYLARSVAFCDGGEGVGVAQQPRHEVSWNKWVVRLAQEELVGAHHPLSATPCTRT